MVPQISPSSGYPKDLNQSPQPTKPTSESPELWLIAAMGLNRVIGANNGLPWHLRCDLQFFKKTTCNHPILMGRKTFESLGSKPLPRRLNLVLSRNQNSVGDINTGNKNVASTATQQLMFFTNETEALAACASYEKIFIIGGQNLYSYALENLNITGILLTQVHLSPFGDAFFPDFEGKFVIKSSQAAYENGILLEWQTWLAKAK